MGKSLSRLPYIKIALNGEAPNLAFRPMKIHDKNDKYLGSQCRSSVEQWLDQA